MKAATVASGVPASAGRPQSASVAPLRWSDASANAAPSSAWTGTMESSSARRVARRSPRERAKRTRKVTAKKKSEAPKSTEQTSRSAAVPVPSRCATIIAAPRASPAPSSAPTIQGRRSSSGVSSGRRSARAKRLIGTSAKARWKSGTSTRVVW